jgi:hypothetical protein
LTCTAPVGFRAAPRSRGRAVVGFHRWRQAARGTLRTGAHQWARRLAAAFAGLRLILLLALVLAVTLALLRRTNPASSPA